MKKTFKYLICFLLIGCQNPIKFSDNLFSVKSENEAFQLELQLSNDVTNEDNPIGFEITVQRINSFPTHKLMGLWKLHSLEIDNISQDISQLSTEMEFRNDNSYSITEENPTTGELSYYGGMWNYDESESQLTLTSLGQEQIINISFDTENNFVALNGFMIWNYVENSNNYKKIFQQTVDYLDLESTTYIYFDASGGEITSTTHASNEIEATIGFNIGDSYNIIGSFEPGLDFNKGNIVVSLENIDYSPITISKEIIIESTNE